MLTTHNVGEENSFGHEINQFMDEIRWELNKQKATFTVYRRLYKLDTMIDVLYANGYIFRTTTLKNGTEWGRSFPLRLTINIDQISRAHEYTHFGDGPKLLEDISNGVWEVHLMNANMREAPIWREFRTWTTAVDRVLLSFKDVVDCVNEQLLIEAEILNELQL